MNQRPSIKPKMRLLLPVGAAAVLGACGGGDGNEPVQVGKSVASYDISGVAANQKQALRAAGAEVASATCYPGLKSGAGMVTEDRTPAVLYVYQVRASDLQAAGALGFSADYSTKGFSRTGRACTSDSDTPADDIQPDDTPASDIPANPS